MGKLTGLVDKPATAETIQQLLEVPFTDPSDPELLVRADLLRKKIDGLKGPDALSVYDRLSDQKSKDKLAVLFYRRLSSTTTTRLLAVLKEKVEQYRIATRPAWGDLRVERERETALQRELIKRTSMTNLSGKVPLLDTSKPAPAQTIYGTTPPIVFPSEALGAYAQDMNKVRYEERLRKKIREAFTREDSRVKSRAKHYLRTTLTLRSAVPASHEFDHIDYRLLYLRYYYEGYAAAFDAPVQIEEAINWIFSQEMAYEKAHGIDYFASFPDKNFSAQYGALNTQAKDQRDFRCATSHHPRTPPPEPEPEVTARDMFLALLDTIHLTEYEYNELCDQMRHEKFSDDEMNIMFSHAYFYKLYLEVTDPTITLRSFARLRLREAEVARQSNEAYLRFARVDTRKMMSSTFRASGNEIMIAAYKVLKALREFWDEIRGILSMMVDIIPVVGQIKGVLEAVTGYDFIAGRELAAWERALAILPGGIEHCGKIVKGLKIAARATAKAAKSPKLLIVLTLAARSGKSPVEVIENMKAVATMSEKVISTASKEVKAAKGATAIKRTVAQQEAIAEVQKVADKLQKLKQVTSPSAKLPSAKQVATVVKPGAVVGKHAEDLQNLGTPDKSSRMVDNKISSDLPKPPPSRNTDTPDALPVNEKRSKTRERKKATRKTKGKQPPKPKPPAEATEAYKKLQSRGWTTQEIGKSEYVPWVRYQTKHSGVTYEYVAPLKDGRVKRIDALEVDEVVPGKLNMVDYKHHKEVEEINNLLKKSNNKFDEAFFKELEKSGHYRGFAEKLEQFLDQAELILKHPGELNKIIIKCSDSRTAFIYTLVKDNLYGNIYQLIKGKFVKSEALEKIVDAIEIVVVK